MVKSWYKLGIKTIVFILCVIVVDIIIGRFFGELEARIYAKDSQLSPTNYMMTDLNSDIVVVGASTASRSYIPSIMEDSLQMSVFNCGFDGTPFPVQNALVNLMLDRYTPKMIVWEMEGLDLEVEKNIQFIRYLYPYYDKNKQVKEVVNSIDKYQEFRMLSNTYRNNSRLLTELHDLFSQGPRASQMTLKGYRPLATTGYKLPSKINKYCGNTLDSNYLCSLETTVKRCQELGVPVVFTSSPRYILNYEEIVSSKSHKAIEAVGKKYNIPYLDYIELYSNDSTIFYDNAHLNDIGAKKYMTVFIPELYQIYNNFELKN